MTDKNKETVEVECPVCHHKEERLKAVLEILAYGCPNCRCVFEHPLMQMRRLREQKMD